VNAPLVLITGGTGLLGKALLETQPVDKEAIATYHQHLPPPEWRGQFHPLDVRDEASVTRLVRSVQPQVVIHAASIGSVDEAERNPLGVAQVNVQGVQAVGRACRQAGAFLIYISSNAVFDGSNPPYGEEAPVKAANRYGRLKIEAETWIRESGISHLILRPILMYGWPLPGGRENAVTRWLYEMERKNTIEVAQDITSMPLFAANCAQAIWAAVKQRLRGILHVAGKDRVSLVDFARQTARIFGCNEDLVIPVPSQRFVTLAPRPRDTSFTTTRMEQELGVRPMGLAEGLTLMQRTRSLVS